MRRRPLPISSRCPASRFRLAMWLLGGLLIRSAPAWAAPGCGEPLDWVRGDVVTVATVGDLQSAVARANAGSRPATLLLEDGLYTLTQPLLHITCPGLIVRSASGHRDRVIIRGPDEGPTATATHIFLVGANDVVIADLTFGYCRYHGVQVQGESPHDVSGLLVHNCRIINCNEQFLKGSSRDDDPVGATDGIIEHCLFEFTSGWAYQYYTGGIDIHKGVNWIVRDNLFRNLRVPHEQGALAEHAVHFWKRCPTRPQNVVVERNWILNCDRGIGFGLVNLDGGHQGGASIIRNNFIANDGTGAHTDVGIGLECADHVLVDNNTVFIPSYWAPIEYRWPASSNLVFRNNLLSGPIANRDGAPAAEQSHNLTEARADWFRNAQTGDLHLLPTATAALDNGQTLADFSDDIDTQARPQLNAWDVGADEYDPSRADSDADAMPDGWEQEHGLNPLRGDGVDGAEGDPDADGVSNWQEYVADTHPGEADSQLRLLRVDVDGGLVRVQARGGVQSTQRLQRTTELEAGTNWQAVALAAPPTPEFVGFEDTVVTSGHAFYRLEATRP